MKPRASPPFEGLEVVLGVATRFGLISASAVALLLGQVLLAAVLAAVAVGVWLRLWRLRRRREAGGDRSG